MADGSYRDAGLVIPRRREHGRADSFGAPATSTKGLSETPGESTGRPDLTEVAIVVSGGRDVNGDESLTVIEALADSL